MFKKNYTCLIVILILYIVVFYYFIHSTLPTSSSSSSFKFLPESCKMQTFDLFTEYNDTASPILRKPEGLMYNDEEYNWKLENDTRKTNSSIPVQLLSDTDVSISRFYKPVKRDTSALNTFLARDYTKLPKNVLVNAKYRLYEEVV